MLKFFKIKILALLLAGSSCSSPQQNANLDKLISNTKNRFAPDNRTELFNVVIDKTNGTPVLHGLTTSPEAKQALLDSLKTISPEVIDSLVVLPDTSVGNKFWGLATLSVGTMRAEPDHAAEIVSQILLGTPVRVLQKHNGWYRVQSPDKYIGWIDDSALFPVTGNELNAWKQSNRYVYRRTEGFAYSAPDEKSSPVSDLVLSDLFVVSGENNGFWNMQFPDGRTGYVPKTNCISYTEWISETPDVTRIIETACSLLGRPYLWGGTSTKAVDCSGLMKTAYLSQAVILARDASQQARYGEILTITDSTQFKPGDLLFFGRSKDHITHVGMYKGNNQYVHSSGLVRINSLNPQSPEYILTGRKSLVSASRILNSLNTEEIIQVKNHPWYN